MAVLPQKGVLLYDDNGQALTVQDGVAVPANTQGLLMHGWDGVAARVVLTDSSRRLVSVGAGVAGIPIGGVASIQGVVGGTPQPVANGDVAAFMASTNGTVSSGTVLSTVTSIAYLFHSASSTKKIKIRRILLTSNGGTNGTLNARGAFITAENGTPGGTSQTINGTDRSLSPDGTDVFRTGATGAPTRVSGDLISISLGLSNTDYDAFVMDIEARPIVLRAGVAEGFEIRTVVTNALVAADQVGISFYWTEE